MKLSLLTEATKDIDKKDTDSKYFAAVAIVKSGNRWLLGLSKNTGDDRSGTWTFPGGHIKDGESPRQAAEREAKEETGVKVRSIADPFDDGEKKGVAFVVCRTHDSNKGVVKPNHEYAQVGYFTDEDMDSLKLYGNVKRLLKKAKYR